MPRYLKRILIAATLFLMGYMLLSTYVDHLLKKLIETQVEKFSYANYRLEIADIETSLWAFNAVIKDMRITKVKHQHLPNERYYFTLSASRVYVKQINPIDLFFNHNLQLRELLIEEPDITFDYNDTINTPIEKDSSLIKLYYELNKVVLKNAGIHVNKRSGEKFTLGVHQLSYSLKEKYLLIDSIKIKGLNSVYHAFDYDCKIEHAQLYGLDLNALLNRMEFGYSSCRIGALKMQMKAHSLLKKRPVLNSSQLTPIQSISGGKINPLRIDYLLISYQSKQDFVEVAAKQFFYASKQLSMHQIDLKLNQKHHTTSNIDKVVITGFDADRLINEKHISISRLIIEHPIIKSSLKVHENYVKALPNTADHIGYSVDCIKELVIHNGVLQLSDKRKPHLLFDVQHIALLVKNLDPQYLYRPNETSTPDHIMMTSGKVHINFPNNIYHLNMQATAYNTHEKRLQIDSLKMQSNYNKNTFYTHVKKQVSRIDLKVHQLGLNGFDFYHLFNNNQLTASSLDADWLSANFYKNKQVPLGANDYMLFPQQLIDNIPYPICIKQVNIKGGQIKSEILNQGACRAGVIIIDQLKARFENIDNRDYQGNIMKASLTGRLAGSGKMKVNAIFDMFAKDYKHQVRAEIGSMPFQQLNSFMLDFASIEIMSGQLNEAIIDISGNNQKLDCNLYLGYNNLSMNLLKNQNKKHKRYRNIASALANTLIYKNNPEPGKRVRLTNIVYTYEPRKFIVGNWITASFNALLITTAPKAAAALEIVGAHQQPDSLPQRRTPKWLQRFLKKSRLK